MSAKLLEPSSHTNPRIKMGTLHASLAFTNTYTPTRSSFLPTHKNCNNFLPPTNFTNKKPKSKRKIHTIVKHSIVVVVTNMGNDVHQNVVVMRHGDRIDNFDAMWAAKAERKWDPELVEEGKVRAFNTGRKLRANLGFPIHRVFVSPFLRCLQTAAEVVSALCADVEGDDNFLNFTKSADGLQIDPSKIKVSIENGLCEMMNTAAIRPEMAPKDGDFGFVISQCESVLPVGTVDHNVESVYKELPKWQETVDGSRSRYVQVMKSLADKYPSENLLLVTHGEGVGSVLSAFLEGAAASDVEYCAYVHVQRPIFSGENQSSAAKSFEVVGQNGLLLYEENH